MNRDRNYFKSARMAIPGLLLLVLVSCAMNPSEKSRSAGSTTRPPELTESWKAYVRRFIQEDGRVIDHKGGGFSTSEGQAYAMLRAVWMADRAVFDKAFRWAKDNLNSGIRQDHLWAWKWGKAPDGNWRVLDKAFASDADQDVALALILASEVWSDPAYLARAREILADLWRLGTIASGGRRYLLAGDTLCQGADCKLNPSYCAPYAYRIFSQYDKSRTWLDLVESSYHLLNTSAKLTGSRLPPDWLLLDTKSGSLRLGSAKDARFSYDAIRTHWRVAFDQRLFQDPRGELYLRQSLSWPIRQWEKTQKLPAVISAEGKPEAAYESPEMLACLLPAMALVSPEIASAIHGRLQHNFKGGIWFDPESYYIQNWVWFGIALQQNYLGPFNEFRRSR